MFFAFCLEVYRLIIKIVSCENRFNTEITHRGESIYLALALSNDTNCHTLHATSTEIILHTHLPPQYRAEFESYDTVKDTSRLLGIHEVHIHCSRVLNRTLDCRL